MTSKDKVPTWDELAQGVDKNEVKLAVAGKDALAKYCKEHNIEPGTKFSTKVDFFDTNVLKLVKLLKDKGLDITEFTYSPSIGGNKKGYKVPVTWKVVKPFDQCLLNHRCLQQYTCGYLTVENPPSDMIKLFKEQVDSDITHNRASAGTLSLINMTLETKSGTIYRARVYKIVGKYTKPGAVIVAYGEKGANADRVSDEISIWIYEMETPSGIVSLPEMIDSDQSFALYKMMKSDLGLTEIEPCPITDLVVKIASCRGPR